MKGLKHIFVRECKLAKVKVKIGACWQCREKEIEVPEQDSDLHLFYGFHELGHYYLHRNDVRDYDDLYSRICIEIEADVWANEKMKSYGYNYQVNNCTLSLIALYIYQGNTFQNYSIEVEDRFITLFKEMNGIQYEIFAQFISNLVIHPSIY